MPETLAGTSQSLPLVVLAPSILLLGAALLLVIARLRHRAATFVVCAVWLRYVISALHEFSFQPALGGLSWNALASVAVVLWGLLVIRPRHLLLAHLLPVYLLVAVVILSGALNGGVGGALDTIVKYAYFVVILVATYDAATDIGPGRFLRALLWSFAPLLLFQALSVALDFSKPGEVDGSLNYIGGYEHEASFSVALATLYVVASFAPGLRGAPRVALLAVALIGIAVANYRTTILALVPLVGAGFVTGVMRRFRPDQRGLVSLAMLVATVTIGAATAALFADRFADLALALSDPGRLVKPPADYSAEEQAMMSGRAYIWSSFVAAYLDAPPLQRLVGLGPDSWVGLFTTYPHNTLVDYLYEFGILGLVALLALWTTMLMTAARAARGLRVRLILAHVSFILLNMATMAHWLIEGLLLYGLLCGYTLHARRLATGAAHGEPRAPSALRGFPPPAIARR